MNFQAYLSIKLRCTEKEAEGIIRARDVSAQLAHDPAFADGLHALAINRSRNLFTQSLAAPEDKRAELFGRSNEAAELAYRLHGIVRQVDQLEEEFKAGRKPRQQHEED